MEEYSIYFRDGELGHTNYTYVKAYYWMWPQNLKNLKTTSADSTVFGNSPIIYIYVCTNVNNLDLFLRELDKKYKLPIKS